MHLEKHGTVAVTRQHDRLIRDLHDGTHVDEIEQPQHVVGMQPYAPVRGEPVDAGRLVGAVYPDARGAQRQPPVAERVVGSRWYCGENRPPLTDHLLLDRDRDIPNRLDLLDQHAESSHRRCPVGLSDRGGEGANQLTIDEDEQHPLRDVQHEAVGDRRGRDMPIVHDQPVARAQPCLRAKTVVPGECSRLDAEAGGH
jgi:hypothetical protein